VATFAALYEQHALEIHDFLVRTVRDVAAAEDLTQMTFLRAFERRSTLSDPGKVRPWLFSIARHLALNQLSRSRPTEDIDARYELAAPQRGPEDQAIAQESAELVWAAAHSLEPRQYAVLDLATRHQMTTPEIAEALEVESSHAAVLVHRAREALGNAVQQLLVARRRTHCERLAELVPAGVSELTPEQRASVDHHMRRCPNCQAMAARLTEPAVILGGIAIVAIPALLNEAHRQALRSALLTGARLTAPPAMPPMLRPAPAPLPSAPRAATAPHIAHHALRAAWIKPVALAGVAAVVVGASVGVAKVLTGRPPSLKPATTTSASPTAPNGHPTWSVVSGPSRPAGGSLDAIACVTPDDCWAVGPVVGYSNGNSLVEHDLGSGWGIVPSADPPGSLFTSLLAITCVDADDCWAVGTSSIQGNAQPVIEQNAGSGWALVPAPLPSGAEGGWLEGVTCASADDCWAVGLYGTGPGQHQVLIEQDTGAGWSVVSSPPLPSGTFNNLVGVTCVDANYCWAVGSYGENAATQPLIEQNTGSGWSMVASPTPANSVDSDLQAVTCPSPGSCWAVGSTWSAEAAGAERALVEENDGDGWSIVPSPTTPGDVDATLNGVGCLNASACWAVGFEQAANGPAADQPLIEQDTGSGWAIVSTPASPGGEGLEGATCAGASDCWAVGFAGKTGSKYQTLIEETG
jgi:RNA polymerase sigma factor (sigma-70 family)